MASRASGSRIVKGDCNFFGFGCKTEYTLTVKLSIHEGEGVGDLHVVSRGGLASVDAKYAQFLSNPARCQFACASVGDKYIYINDMSLSGNKLLHEVFHNIGFKHGNRSRGNFMHTNSGTLRARDLEEIHKHYGN